MRAVYARYMRDRRAMPYMPSLLRFATARCFRCFIDSCYAVFATIAMIRR